MKGEYAKADEGGNRATKNKQRAADPSEEVSTSKFCRCFGYLSFSECGQDCCVQCNFFTLCCNCSRCLAGTCQCMKHIGCIRCAKKIGCHKECINQTCKQESPLCKIIFNGIFIIICAVLALLYSLSFMSSYQAMAQEADALGADYTCNPVPADAHNQAPLIKDAMATAWKVYLVLAIGCLFSCVGGPLLLCRWIAIPFHLLPGLFLHIYAIFTL